MTREDEETPFYTDTVFFPRAILSILGVGVRQFCPVTHPPYVDNSKTHTSTTVWYLTPPGQSKQFDRVFGLWRRYEQIDDPEITFQPVPDKDATAVHQVQTKTRGLYTSGNLILKQFETITSITKYTFDACRNNEKN